MSSATVKTHASSATILNGIGMRQRGTTEACGKRRLTDDFPIDCSPALVKKHRETVVFVHHMGGSRKSPWRHSSYLNKMGFDCVSFDLIFASKEAIGFHPLLRYLPLGIFHVWSKQIQRVFDKIAGDKILYSFSAPSLSALLACENRKDIKKVICDGGPFYDVYKNSKNFFTFQGIKQKQLNAMVSFFGMFAFGYQPLFRLSGVLNRWKRPPVLSIQNRNDTIVFIDSIRKVFAPHKHLDLTVLEIPTDGHLNGLRDFPELYCNTLLDFIQTETFFEDDFPLIINDGGQ